MKKLVAFWRYFWKAFRAQYLLGLIHGKDWDENEAANELYERLIEKPYLTAEQVVELVSMRLDIDFEKKISA